MRQTMYLKAEVSYNAVSKVNMIVYGEQQRLGMWLCNLLKEPYEDSKSVVYIGFEVAGKLTAVAAYNHYRQNGSIFMHIGVTGPITKGFLKAIFYYPFEQLELPIVLMQINSTNIKSLKFARKVGSKEEIVVPLAGTDGCDLHILRLTKKSCKYI